MTEFLKIGMKIDILDEETGNPEIDDARISYVSMLQNIFSNGDLEIDMPVYQRRLILLSNGSRHQLFFHSGKVFYVATGEVVDRYKSDNRYYLRIELKTQPERFQRREYFRCDCLLDVQFHDITEQEATSPYVNTILDEYRLKDTSMEMAQAIALDISGGGMRIVSRSYNEEGSYKRFVFSLPIDGKSKRFNVAGVVLSNHLQEDSKIKYENRIKFVSLTELEREEIIRYIFESERKSRQFSRG